MPAVRSSPHTMSASPSLDTTVTTTPLAGSMRGGYSTRRRANAGPDKPGVTALSD